MAAANVAARALNAPGGINNTAYLFFVLALAFIFFVTIKGDLPKWLGLFGLGQSSASPAGTSAPGTTGVGGLPGLPALPTLGSGGLSLPAGTVY